jgi:hypothetical protein
MADLRLVRIGLAFDGDEAAMTAAVDPHPFLHLSC